MTTDYELSGDHGDQPAFEHVGPNAGDLLRNRHTGRIAVITATATRRRLFITVRRDGRLTDLPLSDIGRHWDRCRPDGTLL